MNQPENPSIDTPSLPIDAGWLFPEYEFAAIELEGYRGVIIERFLEKGSWAQLTSTATDPTF